MVPLRADKAPQRARPNGTTGGLRLCDRTASDLRSRRSMSRRTFGSLQAHRVQQARRLRCSRQVVSGRSIAPCSSRNHEPCCRADLGAIAITSRGAYSRRPGRSKITVGKRQGKTNTERWQSHAFANGNGCTLTLTVTSTEERKKESECARFRAPPARPGMDHFRSRLGIRNEARLRRCSNGIDKDGIFKLSLGKGKLDGRLGRCLADVGRKRDQVSAQQRRQQWK